MPNRGRNINVFLMDGEANGKIKVSISNWNGVAYRIPRNRLDDCRTFEAFNQSGVYFLIGPNNIYIGQAEVRSNGEGLFRRVCEHTTDRLANMWDEVFVFTRLRNTFGRTDISFLEHYFYTREEEGNRFQVLNNNTPSSGTVTEENRCELEEYAEYAELILGVLGYKAFGHFEEPSRVATQQNEPTAPRTQHIPSLPSGEMKIGEYVYTALRQLGESGYVFTDAEISEMCSPEWSERVFHTKKPFMKRYIMGVTDNKGLDGHVRYISEPFSFGSTKVYISKEWYERQRSLFESWYRSL